MALTTKAEDSMEHQAQAGVLEAADTAKRFYIFGHNISHSLSPAMHNAGFLALKLPHHYTIHQSEKVDQSVTDIISQPDFGGASVTFPHKLQIGKLLHSISPRASLIGAVNTVVVKETGGSRTLIGENTDWSGIKACIKSANLQNLESTTAIVLGAGGAARAACYAIQTLGIKRIIIVNRTKATARTMASNFPQITFDIFQSFDQMIKAGHTHSRVMVACIPADDLTEDLVPTDLFSNVESGVLIEMAYRPPVTGLMKVARRYTGWNVFCGTDVLQEQAFAQFEMWTGRQAPTPVMREAVQAKMKQAI